MRTATRLTTCLLGLGLLAGCPERALDKALALEKEGHLKEAGQAYVDLVKQEPANLPAWDHAVDLWCKKEVNVGECMNVLDLELDKLGTIERHHDALAEVLELRARARIEQGLVEPALEDLARAERASPRRSELQSAKARALIHVGRREEAVAALKRARELDPKNAEVDELLKLLPEGDPTPEPEGFGGAKTATTAPKR